MAGERVNTYAQDDSDILALQLTTDKTFKGYHQLTLTEYDTTTVPAIAAGSAIECNGALYKFDTEEAMSTTDPVTSSTVADGTVYVCIVPGATTATAAFTATAPTWSDSKQGWYGTGGQANYRYAEFIITKATTAYSYKNQLYTISKNRSSAFGYAYLSANQSITSAGIETKIAFDALRSSQNITFASNSFTIVTSGEYKIIAGIGSSGTASTSWSFRTYVSNNDYSGLYSGQGIEWQYSINNAPNSLYNFPGHHIMYLKAGAVVEVRVYPVGSLSSFNILQYSYLLVKKIDDYII